MKRAAFFVSALALAAAVVGQARTRDHWVASWTTALIGRPPYAAAAASGQPAPPRVTFPSNQTLRQIVHLTLGGDRLRVVVSNVFGTAPLRIDAAHVALRARESAIVAASDRALTFSGRGTAVVPTGATLVSDAVSLAAPDFADLAIDLYVPDDTAGQTLTIHRSAYQTNYLLGPGNHAGEPAPPDAAATTTWYFIERVDVSRSDASRAFIALGDSITDGTGSTVDANARWPDVFARRLSAGKPTKIAVLNAGIGGNRLLTEGIPEFGVNLLARFDRDVVAQPGITHLVVLEGINDIGNARDDGSPTADDLIAAHRQLIERAHTRGLTAIGATLTPFEGAAYFTETGERKRQALNDWIRNGRAYDGVIDFDAATRDAQQPRHLRAEFDRGDHLHPSDAGYQAMANAINLSLFGVSK
ncbi:MAG TPA: SGNH/GDSL hydrolase family protein [Vicinamibacterales bacterium]|nr:SGNH/GDSL hydrolase family protein [Vicinamibacterales bacterium]